MLREDSVNYSSLPQDEGTTPRSSFVASRSAPNTHNKRDFKLATILTIGVIVAGLGLAATLPFVLKGKLQNASDVDQTSDEVDVDDDYWNSHLNAGSDVFDTMDEETDEPNIGAEVKYVTTAAATVKETTEPVEVIPTEKSYLRPKPVLVTFEDEFTSGEETEPDVITTSFPDWSDSDSEDILMTSINEGSSVAGNGGIGPDDRDSSSEEDKNGAQIVDDVNEPVTEKVDKGKPIGNGGDDSDSEHVPDTNKDDDIDMNQLLDQIYGEEGSAKPSKVSNGTWMSNVVSTQDKATLIILASVVAVALASVVAAVACLVHSRIASRRRRMKIQNVITDLQSRDKIVLLNSESEEE